MESTRGLAQVIMEMRDEIKKLETENQELCGGHALCSVGPTSEEDLEEKEPFEKVENPYLNLRRNVSEPVLEGKFKNTVMTVRRYSTSSNLSGVTTRGARINTEHNNSVWRRLQEEIQHGEDVFTNSVKAEVQKVNTRHSFQEYVHKNAKVKTVTFLLPVDDIYTSRPAL
uniref:Si:ch211-235m3.10 n=2 Tax=Oryzias latipes TaxID=8090 RepID=A0A3P9H6X9_ORYLA